MTRSFWNLQVQGAVGLGKQALSDFFIKQELVDSRIGNLNLIREGLEATEVLRVFC